MSNFWVYGDVHNRVGQARAFLDFVKPKKVIWLGDFNDSFGDTPFESMKTGLFLKETMDARPQDVFIQSNHDISYRYPLNPRFHGWGFTPEKCRAFHSQFPLANWSKFVLFHAERYKKQTIVFSHAGFLKEMLPNYEFNLKTLSSHANFDLKFAWKQEHDSPLIHSHMGPLWWRWPLPLVPGICQVVGHTPCEEPQIEHHVFSLHWNLNLDCSARYVAHFNEEGVFQYDLIHGTKKLLDL